MCLLALCVGTLNRVLVLKETMTLTTPAFPDTFMYERFYQMEDDTVDVLFLGSSHTLSFLSPQELYDRYGITSYNLGSAWQTLLLSYFWLQEALRSQHPKAVVLDCYMIFNDMTEERTRTALDRMAWSPVRWEAVKAVCAQDPAQSPLSYYLFNIRYHERWKDIKKNDFVRYGISDQGQLKGYTISSNLYRDTAEPQEYVPFSLNREMQEPAEPAPAAMEYLDQIEELCRANDIRLILIMTPYIGAKQDRYWTMQTYADAHGLPYLDFNEETLYRQVGLNYAVDARDGGHGNLWGAQKITDWIGNMLREDYRLPAHRDAQWEETAPYYAALKRECELPYQTDLDTYLTYLQDDQYSVFMVMRGEKEYRLPDTIVEKLRALGLSADWQEKQDGAWLCVLSGGRVVEETSGSRVTASGSVVTEQSQIFAYQLEGVGEGDGEETASIQMNGAEETWNRWGLHIVVYDNVSGDRVDSICYPASSKDDAISRP